ncbi:unnamed protein product [Diplocarpon coronariae]|uniref:Uncharacterized protein n=1 Tax=Diplocarpon coronariae TaxID=2795749 RepID=A0A218Z7T1_9HELO|nr:hypothetical protein JHW43_003302 [Diplocarpon mali]OWP04129.1 hypothetical protein B2J93_5950 [Marssonina coronariae]
MHHGSLQAPYSGCMNAAAILHAHGCEKGVCTPGKIDHEFERYMWYDWDGLGEPTATPLKRTWRPPGITEKLPGSHKVPFAAGDTTRMRAGNANGNWSGVVGKRALDGPVDGADASGFRGVGVRLEMVVSVLLLVLVLDIALRFRRRAAGNRKRTRDLEMRIEAGGEDGEGPFEDPVEEAEDGCNGRQCRSANCGEE